MKKRVIAWLMAVCMIAGNISMVYAEEPAGEELLITADNPSGDELSVIAEEDVQEDQSIVTEDPEGPSGEIAAEGSPASEEASVTENADEGSAGDPAAVKEQAEDSSPSEEEPADPAVSEDPETVDESHASNVTDLQEDPSVIEPEDDSRVTTETVAPEKEEEDDLFVPEEEKENEAAKAESDEITSGTIGTNLTWEFNDGVLTISGTGFMKSYVTEERDDGDSYYYRQDTPWYHLRSQIAKVVMGEGITNVGDGAFWNHSNLSSVELPSTITEIGMYAFGSCTGLTSVVLPYGVTSLKDYCFTECTGLTSIVLPDSVTGVYSAFKDCSGLSSVTLSANLTFIGEETFRNCSMLKEIQLPKSLTDIGEGAFQQTALEAVTIPENVRWIRKSAFDCVYSLSYFNIERGYQAHDVNIGAYAFSNTGIVNGMDGVTYNASTTSMSYSGAPILTSGDYTPEILTKAFVTDYDTLVLHIPAVDQAADTFGNDLSWEFQAPGTLKISGQGEMPDFASAQEQPWVDFASRTTYVEIESGVTNVGAYAFKDLTNLTEIKMDQIGSIGAHAFDGCTNLPHIVFPENAQSNLTQVGSQAFLNCTNLTSVMVPSTVTAISGDAFNGCTNLTSIYLWGSKSKWDSYEIASNLSSECPNCRIYYVNSSGRCGEYVTWVLSGANSGADSDLTLSLMGTGSTYDYTAGTMIWTNIRNMITKVEIEDGITSLGNYLFYSLNNLTDITFSQTLTSIGAYTFGNCVKVKAFDLPDSLVQLGTGVFSDCSSLEQVDLPEGVTEIPANAYENCIGIWYEGQNWDSVEVIGPQAFKGCTSLTCLNAPINIRSIGYEAFKDCTQLQYLAFYNEGLQTLEAGVFDGCESLWQAGFPSSLRSINLSYFFRNCKALTTFEIPACAASVGYEAFSGCSALESVSIPVGVSSIQWNAFNGCSSLTSLIIPEGVNELGSNMVYGCSSLKEISIPSTVTSIPDSTFNYCTGLESLTLPDTVISIGEYAFNQCEKLQTIDLPNSLIRIGGHAFANCSKLEQVDLPDSLTNIGEYAFSSGSGLKEMTIPASVVTLGDYVLNECGNIRSITLSNNLKAVGTNAVNSGNSLKDIYFTGDEAEWNAYNLTIPDAATVHFNCFSPLAKINVQEKSFIYDGTEKRPAILVVSRGVTLVENRDYTVSYSENINAGTAKVTITGMGNYSGKLSAYYDILPKEIMVYAEKTEYYDRKQKTLTIPAENAVGLVSGDILTLTDAKITGIQPGVYTGAAGYSWSVAKADGSDNTANYQISVDGKLTILRNAEGKDGTCGTDLIWSLDETGTLLITGTGAMENYTSSQGAPWMTYASEIKTVMIRDGVTSIGNYALAGCSSIKEVTIADTVTSIGTAAFNGCSALQNIYYQGNLQQWQSISGTAGISTACPNCEVWYVTASGLCGSDALWAVHGKVSQADTCLRLTISGSGDINEFNGWYDEENATWYGPENGAPWRDYRNNITSVIVDDEITSWSSYMFANLPALEQVKIGTGADISNYAFQNCSSLTAVDIPDGVQRIGDSAFLECRKLTTLMIPKDVSSIGSGAFANCRNLISVTMPEYLAEIPGMLFYNCYNLQEVSLPEGITSIGNAAFQDCDSLTMIRIPDSVTFVDGQAFMSCDNLADIIFSENLKRVAWNAFSGTAITTIILPESLEDVSETAFSGNNNLKEINFVGTQRQWDNLGLSFDSDVVINCNYFYPVAKAAISEIVFIYDGTAHTPAVTVTSGGKTLAEGTDYTISYENNTNAGEAAAVITGMGDYKGVMKGIFTINKKPVTITASNASMKFGEADPAIANAQISEYVGNELDGIDLSVSIYDYITDEWGNQNHNWELNQRYAGVYEGYLRISKTASELNDTYPNYDFTIKDGTFEIEKGPASALELVVTNYTGESDGSQHSISISYRDQGSTNIFYSTDNENWSYEAPYWSEPTGGLKTVYVKAEDRNFETAYASGTVMLYEPGMICGENLFWSLDKGVLTITGSGDMKFYSTAPNAPWYERKEEVRTVRLEGEITSIEAEAFKECSNLQSITIPNSVEIIGANAFSHCEVLKTIQLPAGLTQIENNAFYECSELTSIEIPSGVKTINSGLFQNCYKLKTVTLPEGITEIQDNAFYYCRELETINLPEGLTRIGNWAFHDCKKYKSIILPQSLTRIESYAFSICSSVEELVLPDHISYIGEYALSSLYSLKSITIPDSISILNNGFLADCSSLTNVTLPESLISIGNSAFSNCSSLVSLTIPDGITSLRAGTFTGCSNLLYLTLPSTLVSINKEAFSINGAPKNICYIGTEEQWNEYGVPALYYNDPELGNIPTEIHFEWFYPIASIELSQTSYVYDGNAKQPALIVTSGGKTLAEGTDYTVSYENNTNAGEAAAVITGMGDYKGVMKEKFFIKYPASDLKLTVKGFVGEDDAGVERSVSVTCNDPQNTIIYYSTDNITWDTERKYWVEPTDGPQTVYVKAENPKYETAYASGTVTIYEPGVLCGENLLWTLENGVLTITGSGDMKFYSTAPNAPWHNRKDEIRTVRFEGEITSIAESAFEGCKNLTEVIIPKSVTAVRETAFAACPKLSYVEIQGENTYLGWIVFYGDFIERMVLAAGVKVQNSVFEDSGICEIDYLGTEEQWNAYGVSLHYYEGNDDMNPTHPTKVYCDYFRPLATVTLEKTSYVYDGTAHTPAVTVVSSSGTPLVQGTDYTVSYANNKNAGTATVTIKGKGQYAGSMQKNFTIKKASQTLETNISEAKLSVGKTKTITASGAEGIVTYSSNKTGVATVSSTGVITAKKVGTATITVKAAATTNYSAATKKITVTVVPAATSTLTTAVTTTGIKLTWKKVTGATGYYIYRNGTQIKKITSGSTVTVTDKGASNGVKTTYKVTAYASTGKSTLSKSVVTYPLTRATVSSLKSSTATKLTVNWKKNSKASGYQIRYSTKSSFATGSATKTIKVAGASKVTKTLTSLKSGKKYYVKVRAYKTVNGKTYYSAWSPAKNLTVK